VATATLQLAFPPVQGTLFVPSPTPPVGKRLLPLVTSLNMQVAASVVLDVQLAPLFFANWYKM
jgi:hypothetical protein